MNRVLQLISINSSKVLITHSGFSAAGANLYMCREKSSNAEIIDYSRVPVLDEKDIDENFIKGGGPGGSNVNKTVSCVSLKHKPTGITVKCQFSRLLHQNRVIARQSLVEKLDVHLNGEMSVKAQQQRLEAKKSQESSRKSRNLAELKKNYKLHVEKQGLNDNNSSNSDSSNLVSPETDNKDRLKS